jgi:hypothetical protein
MWKEGLRKLLRALGSGERRTMKPSRGKSKTKGRPAAPPRRAKARPARPAPKARPKPKHKAGKPARPVPKARPAPPRKGKPEARKPAGGKDAARKPSRPAGSGAARPEPPAPHPVLEAVKAAGLRPAPALPVRKSQRKSTLAQRRGPSGEPFSPGDLLLPGGPQTVEEIAYLLRGSVAAEHDAVPVGVDEVVARRSAAGVEVDRLDLTTQAVAAAQRFQRGAIESMLPPRPPARRNFPGVQERARWRRREIGAFLRGLDLGQTETSHMDSHGEASLQSLMEWAARLENLGEASEPERADYAQFHRGLDQLDHTTEALIIDVEQTLRRLRDRVLSS